MQYSPAKTSRGFTLVEIIVVVPLVMITVGIIISFLTNLTGDAMKSKNRVEATYNVQSALDQIEQDIRISTGALTRTTDVTSPQGVNNNFNGSGDFNNTNLYLVLQQNATTDNPYNSARKQVYYNNQPNSCSGNKELNNPLQITVVYFVDNGLLKKRTIMPEYNTNGSDPVRQVCDEPWQKNSCKTTSPSNCRVEDDEILIRVTDFSVDYYLTPGSTSPITSSSQIPNADSIRVSLTSSSEISGETVDATAAVRATKLNPTKEFISPPSRPQITHDMPSPSKIRFDWSGLTGSNFYDVSHSIDGGSWQTDLSNNTDTSLTLDVGHDKQVSIRVTAKNIAGSSSTTSYTASTPLWANLSLENNWEVYSQSSFATGFTRSDNGEVFLRGLVKKSDGSSGSEAIAYLPEGYRPNKHLIFAVMTGGENIGRIDVTTNGEVRFVTGTTSWVSLDSIRFMTTDANCTLTDLSFTSNWRAYGGVYGALQSCVEPLTHRVHISGLVSKNISGTPPNYDTISYFPDTSTRSLYSRIYPANTNNSGTPAGFQINKQDSNLKSQLRWRTVYGSWLSTIGVYYSSAYSDYNSLNLQAYWVPYSSDFSSGTYTKSGNIVTLSGLIKDGTTSKGTVIATLPSGYRPSSKLVNVGVSYGGESNVRIDIDSSGNVILNDSNISSTWVSLENITFIAG